MARRVNEKETNHSKLIPLGRGIWLTGLLFASNVTPSLPAAEIFSSAYISEFMAANEHGVQDEDGDRTGWIEIYNASPSTIRLGNWFLTDSPTSLTKWRFPGVSLLPDKYLLVFASAKNRTRDLVHLHTNFRLDKQGSYLALVGPATNVVSEFAPTPQIADVSYGRVRAEPSIHGPM